MDATVYVPQTVKAADGKKFARWRKSCLLS